MLLRRRRTPRDDASTTAARWRWLHVTSDACEGRKNRSARCAVGEGCIVMQSAGFPAKVPAMSLDRVPAGRDLPNDCNVVIEIPMRADPIKYEVDKETGAVFVDRFMSTAMHYPCNYGYIPQTLSDDGDPCDVLVLSPVPLITGVVVRCRPIGMLKMDDEAGGDSKILAVPIDKLSSLYRDVKSPRDLPADHDAADRALLRALQGPRARQVGARGELGGGRGRAARDRRQRRALREDAAAQEEVTPAHRSPRRRGRLRRSPTAPDAARRRRHPRLSRRELLVGRHPARDGRARARELAQLRPVPARRADRARALRHRPRDVRVPRRRVRAARRIAGRGSRRGSSARR